MTVQSWRERPATMISAHRGSATRYLTGRYDRPMFEWPVRVALHIGLKARQLVELRTAP